MKTLFLFVLLSSLSLSACTQDRGLATVEKLVRSKYPDVEQVSTADLAYTMQHGDSSFILIDTREVHEYEVSHLPGAIRIDPDATTFPELRDVPRDTRVVAYCSVGYRSSEVVTRLQAEGFTNVANLEGSIFRWGNEGRPLEKQGEAVTTVHPYNKTWSKLLDEQLRDYGQN